HATNVFVQKIGHQVEPADQLAEFALETEVGGVVGHFVGQQQGGALLVAAAGQQPCGGLHVAGGVVDVAGIEHVRHIEARLAAVRLDDHVRKAQYEGGNPVAVIVRVERYRQYLDVVQALKVGGRVARLDGGAPLPDGGVQIGRAGLAPFARVA